MGPCAGQPGLWWAKFNGADADEQVSVGADGHYDVDVLAPLEVANLDEVTRDGVTYVRAVRGLSGDRLPAEVRLTPTLRVADLRKAFERDAHDPNGIRLILSDTHQVLTSSHDHLAYGEVRALRAEAPEHPQVPSLELYTWDEAQGRSRLEWRYEL